MCQSSSDELRQVWNFETIEKLAARAEQLGQADAASHLAVLVGVLEGLHQPERLVHAPAHGKVVHGDLTEGALVVNDEQAPVRVQCQIVEKVKSNIEVTLSIL